MFVDIEKMIAYIFQMIIYIERNQSDKIRKHVYIERYQYDKFQLLIYIERNQSNNILSLIYNNGSLFYC